MRSDCVFFCPIRVRYGEVDRQGIVYNGNYVAYTDLALEEFLRSRGCTYRELEDKYESGVCHKKSTYEFNSSAYEGDMLVSPAFGWATEALPYALRSTARVRIPC